MAKFAGGRVDPEASLKPGITLFSKKIFSKKNAEDHAEDLRENSDVVSPINSFLHMELFVELKHDTQCDPFRDLGNGEMEESYSIDNDNTRG